jgi:hypothetical protein
MVTVGWRIGNNADQMSTVAELMKSVNIVFKIFRILQRIL